MVTSCVLNVACLPSAAREHQLTKRVGVYSGTFDPIHSGHIAFAEQALVETKLDKLFFLVEPRPRRKQGVRALEHREAMVKLAIAEFDSFGSIQLEQSSFTVEETLPKLKALFKGADLHFLMGEDVFSHLNNWPNVDELLVSSSFIVGIRKHDEAKMRLVLEQLQKTRGLKFKVNFIITENHNVSSTNIRLSYKRGTTPKGIIAETEDYIKENGLYVTEE